MGMNLVTKVYGFEYYLLLLLILKLQTKHKVQEANNLTCTITYYMKITKMSHKPDNPLTDIQEYILFRSRT
jgi:hypothetical protein